MYRAKSWKICITQSSTLGVKGLRSEHSVVMAEMVGRSWHIQGNGDELHKSHHLLCHVLPMSDQVV